MAPIVAIPLLGKALAALKGAGAAVKSGKAGMAAYKALKAKGVPKAMSRFAGDKINKVGRGVLSYDGFAKNLGMPMTKNDIENIELKMKSIIIASVAMLGLTGCAQLTKPLGECTNVMYYNEKTPQYAALGAVAGTAAMVVLSDGNVGGTDALFGAATGALAGTVASGGLYTAEICPSMTEVLKEVQ